MVYPGTYLKVLDNTGIKKVKCIKILNVNRRDYGKPGDIVIVSFKRGSLLKMGLEKDNMSRALIVRVKSKVRRLGGELISFEDNSVVLLKNDDSPLGSRVLGTVMVELREKKFMKVVSLALLCI